MRVPARQADVHRNRFIPDYVPDEDALLSQAEMPEALRKTTRAIDIQRYWRGRRARKHTVARSAHSLPRPKA